jgi:hypothetical protein
MISAASLTVFSRRDTEEDPRLAIDYRLRAVRRIIIPPVRFSLSHQRSPPATIVAEQA